MKIRSIAVVMTMILIIGTLASCGKKEEPTKAPSATNPPSSTKAPDSGDPVVESDVPDYMNEFGYPIAKEMTTYTVFMTRDEADGRWEDLELMQWLEELTNVHFEYDSVSDADEYRNRLGLMFASDTYPDILMPRAAIEWRHEDVFSKDGYFLDVKPLIERWMPNAQEVLEKFPQLKAGQTSANGEMYGFPFHYEGKGGNPHNWYMEPYWMRAAGWDDVPNTVEEMKDFMYDIKAVMDSGDYLRPEQGMYVLGYHSPNSTGLSTMSEVMLTAYTGALASLDKPWAAPDMQNVEFLVEHPGYKETVRFFYELYRDGLIDPDVFTMDSATFNAKKNTCKYAMYTGSSSALEIDLIRDDPPANPGDGYACMAIRPMTSQWNDRPMVKYETEGVVNQTMLTDKCEKPEIIARWLDIFYNMNYDPKDNSEPNSWMFMTGYYGEHWSFTDASGNPVDDSTDFWAFLPNRNDGQTNDDGTPALIDWGYSRNYLAPGWNIPAGYHGDAAFSVGNERYVGKQRTTGANVYPYCTTDTKISDLARMTQEEVDAVSTKQAELIKYLGEQFGLFMSGQKNIDTDWDAFVAECYRLGAQEVTDVYQAVYDRWNAALQ